MSFTLMRYKDGKPAPIKLSIWDAFKGVPPPKPRLHQCSSCNGSHRPETKTQAKSEQLKSKEDSKSSAPEKKDGNGEEHHFTKEEDNKILKLKADGNTWAQIATEIGGGRHKSDVSRRHKQLMATESEAKPDDKAEKADCDKLNDKTDDKPQADLSKISKKEKRAAKAKQDREEGLKKREEEKAKENDGNKKPSKNDDSKSEGASSNASTKEKSMSSGNEDKQKWITAASKHFDKTGQRITADQARKMVGDETT